MSVPLKKPTQLYRTCDKFCQKHPPCHRQNKSCKVLINHGKSSTRRLAMFKKDKNMKSPLPVKFVILCVCEICGNPIIGMECSVEDFEGGIKLKEVPTCPDCSLFITPPGSLPN